MLFRENAGEISPHSRGARHPFPIRSTASSMKKKSAQKSAIQNSAEEGKHTRETGGRTVVELAGLRRRIASMVYEGLLLAGILALTFMVPNLILGVLFSWSMPGWAMWIHVLLVLGGYFVWYWTRQGQTLAMQTWRLRIVSADDGRSPRASVAWLRYLLCWPSLWLFGIGVMWALVDRDRQFLHDRLAGTRIVLLPLPPKAKG